MMINNKMKSNSPATSETMLLLKAKFFLSLFFEFLLSLGWRLVKRMKAASKKNIPIIMYSVDIKTYYKIISI